MTVIAIRAPSPTLRAGIQAILSAEADFRVVSSAGSLRDLLPAGISEGLLITTRVDEIELLSELSTWQGWSILWMTDAISLPQTLWEIMRVRDLPWGMLSLVETSDALLAALRALSAGLMTFSQMIDVQVVFETTRTNKLADTKTDAALTHREIEVLLCVAEGMSNKQIALRLSISEHTVKFHMTSIFEKLQVANRVEAVQRGMRLGLVAV